LLILIEPRYAATKMPARSRVCRNFEALGSAYHRCALPRPKVSDLHSIGALLILAWMLSLRSRKKVPTPLAPG
jgi:hypothetical protein